MSTNSERRKSSLTEFFVVSLIIVAVLVVLAALIMPATKSAQEAANRAVAMAASEARMGVAERTHRGTQLGRAFADPAPAAGYAYTLSEEESEGIGAGENITSTTAGLNRKIIYNAEIELAVEDFAGVPDRVVELVKKFDAYVADSNLAGSTGENRRGTWKIRVPVERFDEFVGAAKGLGELVRVGTSSRDVSEEYYDVEARIRNKTKEEERLLKLLEERPGKLEDVIAIERELSRVREELERMQGRMRVLADLTSLTTVDLTVTEIRGYKPAEAPTLATRIRRSFDGSLVALKTAGEELLIAAVALAPWLPIVAVLVAVVFFGGRRLWTRLARASAHTSGA